MRRKLAMAAENWDFPIVVTTNVQFFESLFSNKRSRCRKLHNLANSIIVLDEAQLMNGEFYKPCLHALEELSRHYGATVVLSTATQPDIRPLFTKPVSVREMISDLPLRFEQFRRVSLESMGHTDYDLLTERISRDRQALCIVNTRKAARTLYTKIRTSINTESVFHLSARMCAHHRKRKLEQIYDRLDRGLPCILVSTQLIECGVDIDFPVVYRELAGLDSIAQAVGRCNRNGTSPRSTAYVFETSETLRTGWFGLTANASAKTLKLFAQDPLSLEALQHYFKELYFYQTLGEKGGRYDRTDKYGILSMLDEHARKLSFPFETVSRAFRLIQTDAQPVIVGYDDASRKQLEALPNATEFTDILRKLQSYVVQLYPNEFAAFLKAGEIVEVREGVYRLLNPDRWYDEDIGIRPFSEKFHAEEVHDS
ncbi:hypothetical protein GCM10020370_11070 [Paenibacillus hodogayensis]